MARYRYFGRLTNFQRYRLNASREVELWVEPEQPGYAATGLMNDMRIPVTVDPDTGDFEVLLEATSSVRPAYEGEVFYTLKCKWLDGGTVHQSEWVRFRAAVGGGNVFDIASSPAPPWSIQYGYGTPASQGVTTGLYIDISGSTPTFYAPEEGRI